MSEQKHLYAALAVAQSKIGHLDKSSHNPHHGYDYTSAEDMLTGCRAALLDAGVVLTRRWCLKHDEHGMMLWSLFVMYHAESGEHEETEVNWPVIPGKGRPEDKALAASLTSSLGYYLRDLLMVARGGEEMDRRDDRDYAPRQRFQPEQAAGAPIVMNGNAAVEGPPFPDDPEFVKLLETLREKTEQIAPGYIDKSMAEVWAGVCQRAAKSDQQPSQAFVASLIGKVNLRMIEKKQEATP